jgi:hypothetical protein
MGRWDSPRHQRRLDVQDRQDRTIDDAEDGGHRLVCVDDAQHVRSGLVDLGMDEALAGGRIVALELVAVQVDDHHLVGPQVAHAVHAHGVARLDDDAIRSGDACTRVAEIVGQPEAEQNAAGGGYLLAQVRFN